MADTAKDLVNSIFQSWGRPLLRYAISLTHDRAAAEDIVQESFLSLYASLSDGVVIHNPRSWTLAVARNLVYKQQKEQARCSFGIDNYEDLPSLSPDIEAHMSGLAALEAALRCLTEREQQVLLLRMESLRYEEIGSELGITAGTVATLLSRALKKVRKTLATQNESSQLLAHRKDVSAQSLQ